MAFRCPECSSSFTARTALCIDWKDPNKSFGCPHCETFYVKDMKPKFSELMRIGIFAGGIMTPSTLMIGQYFSKDEPLFLIYGLAILFSCFVFLFLETLNINNELIMSSYNKQRNTDSGATAPAQVR